MADLDPILAKIPKNATPEVFDDLRRDEKGPSREDGTALIDRMAKFRADSEAIYQSNLAKMDAARSLVAAARNVQYLSLFDIAGILLPSSLKGDQGYPPHALYAVHSALYQNEVGFSPLSPSADCHRRDHLFEVLPQNHSNIAAKIAAWVREYTDSCAKRLRALDADELTEVALGRFILQAREAVLRSRQTRQWSKHGILEPSLGATIQGTEWSPVSKDVLQFLEWWASYNLFDAGSRYHSYGAIILRSLDLYDRVALDQSTAWIFLQEVGLVAPWEIPSRYRVRFPGTTIDRGGGLTRPIAARLDKSTRPDIAAGSRKTRFGQTIFCIDAPSTVVIDDGISLERTNKSDEFWIHVHAADPASVVQPNSELCKFMELIPENIYLPGHFQAMLPSNLGDGDGGDYASESLVKQFSLRSGVPALTFSAKVNEAGDILDYAIEPSTLEDVRYLDPDDVSKFCNEPAPPAQPETYSFAVGTQPKDELLRPNREMTSTAELDQASKADLLTLHRLSLALKQKRLGRGAWPYFFPRASVQVSFHQADAHNDGQVADLGTKVLPQDPYIKVGMESSSGCAVVSNTMVLAGQVAAKWCATRGIPLPYRRDSKSSQNYEAALDYVTHKVYPLIDQGVEPSASQRQELSRLTGPIEMSTEPGAYFLLGLDMYAKATSPLRRFSDLIVHWQIHAALAHERQTGRQMDRASEDDATLPFTSASLRDETLPLLQMREKMARAVSRGTRDWMLIALVRAWQFERTAPTRFKFTAGSRWRQGLLGRLDMFDLPATMDVGGLSNCRLIKDVRVGDTFEVELADVNVHSRQILVTAIRYLGHESGV